MEIDDKSLIKTGVDEISTVFIDSIAVKRGGVKNVGNGNEKIKIIRKMINRIFLITFSQILRNQFLY